MQNIRAITLDLDDTLWAIGPVIARAEQLSYDHLTHRFPRIKTKIDVDGVVALRTEMGQQNPEISHDFTELRLRTFRHLLNDAGYSIEHAESLMEHFLEARHEVEFFPDAIPALRWLSSRFPVISLSNGNADLSRLNINKYFSGIMNARMAGVAKPHRDIYLAACAKTGIAPAQTLHIGDHPVEDVLGAQQAGLKTIWINRCGEVWNHKHFPDYQTTTLSGVTDWLSTSSK